MKRAYLYYLFCIALILVNLLINLWWLKVDTQLPYHDPAYQHSLSIKYGKILQNFSLNSFKEIAKVNGLWPPFVGLLIGPFILNLKLDMDGTVFLMDLIFLPILIFSIFKIVQILATPFAGIFSAFLITVYPGTMALTRYYNLYLPMMAIISFSSLVLLKTDEFKNIYYVLFFGILIGIGLLIKQTFLIFISPFLLLVLFWSIKNRSFKLTFFSILLALLIASIWYLANFREDFMRVLYLLRIKAATGTKEANRIFFTFRNLGFYLLKLINSQSSFIYFLIWLISTLFFLKFEKIVFKFFILFWFFWIYIMFTIIIGKDSIYSVPILIPMSIISSIGIMQIKRRAFRNIFQFFIVLYAIFQFAVSTFGFPFLPDRIATKFNKDEIVFFSQDEPLSRYLPHYKIPKKAKLHELEKIETVIEKIRLDNKNRASLNILLLSNFYIFNMDTLNYFCSINNIDFSFDNILHYLRITDVIRATKNKKFSYLIYAYQKKIGTDNDQIKINTGFQWLRDHPKEFIPIYKFMFPDMVRVIIYKHNIR